MQARISVPVYRCAPEGHTVLSFAEGTVVSGAVAQLAITDGAGVAMDVGPIETKITPPPEAKIAARKRGRPPRAKDE